jgi:oxalate decarboxylase/phosphoglucose isomerase-like protein (cupin superfamily)
MIGGHVLPEAELQFLNIRDSLHQDERGFAYFPFQDLPASLPLDEMCRSCHIISIEPGHIRGQHQHPGKTECLMLVHGTGQLYWRTRDGRIEQRRLSDVQTLVVIPPGIPHTLRNEGSGPLYLFGWRAASGSAGAEPDTVPETLI